MPDTKPATWNIHLAIGLANKPSFFTNAPSLAGRQPWVFMKGAHTQTPEEAGGSQICAQMINYFKIRIHFLKAR